MAQGSGREPCLGPNVNFFWKRFLYLIILIKKPLFLFFQISVSSSLNKFENEKWPKAGYLPLYIICYSQVT